MINKVAINTYLSTIESKKQNKQTCRTETDTKNILIVARREGDWGNGRTGWKGLEVQVGCYRIVTGM